MSFKRDILLRVRVAFILVCLFVLTILYRVFVIQTVEGDKWRDLADQIGLKFMTAKATRGNIYSDNGSLLATSLPFYRVALDPTIAPERVYKKEIDSLCFLLSKRFPANSEDFFKRKINQARRKNRKYIVLSKRVINYIDKKKMVKWPIFRYGRLRGGVIFEKIDKRFNPFDYMAYRTVGYVNGEGKGVAGLEYSFQKELAGRNGKALYERIAGGDWKPIYDGTEVKPKDGYDIETTINVNMQDVVQTSLLKGVILNAADYGSAVVMEVETGEIKAIANLSRNVGGKYAERYNYALGNQGVREPGSTFKLASMIALFEDQKISLSDTIDTGDGTYTFYDQVMKDHRYGGYGKLSVSEVFEYSSNIGVAKLIDDRFSKKPQKFISYLKKMGVMKPLGLQMVGEGKPYIKTPSDSSWSGVTLPWMSTGYELELSPLHTLTLYNAVANKGKMVKPIIVKRLSKEDRVIEEYDTETISDKICSSSTLSKVRRLLEGVVQRGTAKNIKDSYYRIAGKTGTAKKFIRGRYTNKYYTSFVGYFPADKPKYSCIVVVDNPRNGRIYGSDVAAPIFKNIADKIYTLDVEVQELYVTDLTEKDGVFPVIRSGNYPDLEVICHQLDIPIHERENVEWAKTIIEGNTLNWKKNKMSESRVPDVVGMTLKDALFLLENEGLKVKVNGRGRVKQQSLTPGAKVGEKRDIKLFLS